MTFTDYQSRTSETAVYPGQGGTLGLVYVTLGLAGEAGELANKVKKILRDKEGLIDAEDREALAQELGDILWYAAQFATEIERELGAAAWANIEKLAGRKARGTLKGSGDNR